MGGISLSPRPPPRERIDPPCGHSRHGRGNDERLEFRLKISQDTLRQGSAEEKGEEMNRRIIERPRPTGFRKLVIAVPFAIALLSPIAGFADAASCSDNSDPTRSQAVEGDSFMVAAANPLAVQAGCDVLKAGGSAIDAAVAVQAALAVVEPQSSGLAGGAVITYWDAAEKRVRFFEGLSGAPEAVTDGLRTPTEADLAACGLTPGQSFSSRAEVTGRAFGVPGALRALDLAHRQFGAKDWNQLFEAAIGLAETGFAMPPYLNTIMGESTRGLRRCQYPDLAARYCDRDSPKAVGTAIFNPALAAVLREVRDGGADAFYDPDGTIAPAIVARITEGACQPSHDTSGPVARPAVIPSLMTTADFAAYRARERDPLCRFVLGQIVCSSAPPAFGGTAVLYMLALMERGGIRDLAPGSLAQAHLFIESSRLAQFDRRQYVGDPDFNYMRVPGLLDSGYLASRFQLFSPDGAIQVVEFGDPPGGLSLAEPDQINDTTSHVSIVDGDGNALAMTTTINTSFGNQMEARGIALNNVQTNFTRLDSISPGKPVNVMESRKKARTSIAPTLVFDRRGRLKLVVGAAGGGAIPDYVAQTILGVALHDLDPQAAINQDHLSGQAITSNCGGIIGPRSELESGTPAAGLLDGLRGLGHPCARATRLRSGLTAIQIRPNGKLLGAADPRRDGVAMGE